MEDHVVWYRFGARKKKVERKATPQRMNGDPTRGVLHADANTSFCVGVQEGGGSVPVQDCQ